MKQIVKNIREQLSELSDENFQKTTYRFFKEPIQCYGVRSATVKAIGNAHFKLIKDLSKKEIFELCEQLWQSGNLEENMIACEWSYKMRKQFMKDDFEIFKNWIDNYITNWATCDTFCNHTMGNLMEKYPELMDSLKLFTKSDNRWMRRAAAVSLIVPAKKGMFLTDVFEVADILLLDEEDLVQKGYGWLLKVASHTFQKEVFEYVIQNKSVMPRTALRYAIEKMPVALKQQAMIKPN